MSGGKRRLQWQAMNGSSTGQDQVGFPTAEWPSPERATGLYVHVPFCASTCDFCAFYQEQPEAGQIRRYLEGVAREAELVPAPARIDTVFIGGGTPGLLAPRDLARLLEVIRGRCGGVPREWSIELAPGSVTPERLAVLRAGGVTRVSLGVQSFQPTLLEALGRRHSLAQIERAWEWIHGAGFASVNLDLMFALPGQTAEEWAADVRRAVELGPDHLSTYCLTFEEDTRLWLKLSQGRVRLDPEFEARLYEDTWAQLATAGYAQYEVSNFARPGHACAHNVATWRMGQWIGLGPSAASQQGEWRGSNVADTEAWLAALARGERLTGERTRLTPALLAEDAVIFGLRMNAGVELAPWRQRVPELPWLALDAELRALEAEGMLQRSADTLRLTPRGRLLADALAVRIISALEPGGPA
jgi:oxygen-independent coproporphyrinogen-3 oxidase